MWSSAQTAGPAWWDILGWPCSTSWMTMIIRPHFLLSHFWSLISWRRAHGSQTESLTNSPQSQIAFSAAGATFPQVSHILFILTVKAEKIKNSNYDFWKAWYQVRLCCGHPGHHRHCQVRYESIWFSLNSIILLQVRCLEGLYSSSWPQAFRCKHAGSKRFKTSSPAC